MSDTLALSRSAALVLLRDWLGAWRDHDLEGVLELLHEDIEFQNWTGTVVQGKASLRKAWGPWFRNHGGFLFTEEGLFFDPEAQMAWMGWRLDWPTREKAFLGQPEIRHGVDLLGFRDGKISKKCSYSKTTVQINGRIFPKQNPL